MLPLPSGTLLLLSLFVLLRGIDTSLTQWALTNRKVKELNPLVRLFHRVSPRYGVYAYLVVNTIFVCLMLAKAPPLQGAIAMVVAVLCMMYVVQHNLSVLRGYGNG